MNDNNWPPSNIDSVLKRLDEASALHMKKEIEELRAKLEKAQAVIDIASKYSVGWLDAWKNEFNDAYDNYQKT